jgi:hypothetical protein
MSRFIAVGWQRGFNNSFFLAVNRRFRLIAQCICSEISTLTMELFTSFANNGGRDWLYALNSSSHSTVTRIPTA